MNVTENDKFILLPAVSGGGALVRSSQIAGGRANGQDGAIVYLAAGPSVYTTATVPQLAKYLGAEVAEIRRD
jgi:spore maturation protein SpmB